jgi:hypothetical protein
MGYIIALVQPLKQSSSYHLIFPKYTRGIKPTATNTTDIFVMVRMENNFIKNIYSKRWLFKGKFRLASKETF